MLKAEKEKSDQKHEEELQELLQKHGKEMQDLGSAIRKFVYYVCKLVH